MRQKIINKVEGEITLISSEVDESLLILCLRIYAFVLVEVGAQGPPIAAEPKAGQIAALDQQESRGVVASQEPGEPSWSVTTSRSSLGPNAVAMPFRGLIGPRAAGSRETRTTLHESKSVFLIFRRTEFGGGGLASVFDPIIGDPTRQSTQECGPFSIDRALEGRGRKIG
jgi:hypothetical protein